MTVDEKDVLNQQVKSERGFFSSSMSLTTAYLFDCFPLSSCLEDVNLNLNLCLYLS